MEDVSAPAGDARTPVAGSSEDPEPLGGQMGGASLAIPCNVVSERTLALQEVSSLGFAPRDVLPFAIGTSPFQIGDDTAARPGRLAEDQ
jgi:hypothetical protein